MKSSLKKLNGFLYANRDILELLAQKTLTQEEFVLYIIAIFLCDWDERHEHFGTFKAIDQKLAYYLGLKSKSTANIHKNSLINKGFLEVLGDGRIKPKNFEQWKFALKSTEQKIDRNTEQLVRINGQGVLETEQLEANNVSSKVNLSLTSSGPDESLSDEELDKIIQDIDSQVKIKLATNLNFLDSVTRDEQLRTSKEIFGEGTRWVDET